MAEIVVCPVCGETNPIELEFCRNCHASLEGIAGPVKREDANPGPDLLAGLASQNKPENNQETPEWVRSITGAHSASENTEPPETHSTAPGDRGEGEQGDSSSIAGSRPHQTDPQPKTLWDKDDLTDWFKQASADVPAQSEQTAGADSVTDSGMTAQTGRPTGAELPEWLSQLEASNHISEPGASERPDSPSVGHNADVPPSQDSIPDWLKDFDAPASGATESTPQTAGEIPPDQLHDAAPSTEAATSSDEGAAPEGEPFADQAPALEPAAPGMSEPETADEPPAFTPDGAARIDADAILASMQMPDWLSSISPAEMTGGEDLPPAAQGRELIAPAELPSWVQALRPVESAMPEPPTRPAELRLEERGPLAGLHGVLPVIPGAAEPSSKPKAQSASLDITVQQQAHAALLDRILEAEATSIPMKVAAFSGAPRGLRWAISALLLVTVGATVLSGSQIFPLPGAVPNETVTAVRAIEDIPPGAPVLAVFDYEPATVGEMEASAGSLMDHLLLLKHPRLAVLSTSPTGAVLADRFMSTALAARGYQRGAQYMNLGYLPGGLTGVYDFAQNPAAVIPLGMDSTPVWASPVLNGVTHLSDFAAIIILTDSLEAGRVWIEQTEMGRGSSPMVVVSSAQAGPMLLPYVDSGQVKGLVAGVNGAAGAEQANGGLPGLVRQYWDAYSVGLYLAVLLIAAGALWNSWLGMQGRREQQVG